MMLVSLLFVSVLVANTLARDYRLNCPGWFNYYQEHNTCLMYYTDKRSFYEARRICQKMAADLVQANDPTKMEYLNALTLWNYWIGAWDQNSDKHYTFLDGRPVPPCISMQCYHQQPASAPWLEGEPNNNEGKEHCVAANGPAHRNTGKWYDENCDAGATFVCERKVRGCPEGYLYYSGEDTCLKYHGDLKNFYDARKTCMSQGDDLAMVRDAVKATFISALHPSYHWMGVWDEDKDGHFTYIDGSPVGEYHPWSKNEPNDSGTGQHCVGTLEGEWDNVDCQGLHTFVCERDTGCPIGYTYYRGDNTCLKSYPSKKNYDDARTVCQNQGGDLVQNKDDAKTQFIADLHAGVYWMGVMAPTKKRDFSFIDGTQLGSYQPWKKGEPNNSGGDENCIMVYGTDNKDHGKWNDAPCHVRLAFVCEIK